MSAARSEHEVSEIIDGLSEQEVRLGQQFSWASSPLLLSSPLPLGEELQPSPTWRWEMVAQAADKLH